MSTVPPTEAAAANKADSKEQQQGSQPAASAAAAAAAPDAASNAAPSDAPKKLSGAELKALKQAEKAKRRAAVVAAKEAAAAGGGSGVPQPQQTQSAAQKQGKAKGKQDGAASGTGASGGKITGPLVRHPPGLASGGAAGSGAGAGATAANAGPGTTAAAAAAAMATVERDRDPRSGIPECFSHLSMAKRIPLSQAHKDVHPAVLAVGQQMASFVLRDNMARLEATLTAFKKVIQSYRTPPGNAFSRHFVSHVLNPQIEYLTECRPMCFAMGNAIRILKARVSHLDLDTDDADAIDELCESLDVFIQERIFVAAVGIAREAAAMIHDGDVILTYGGPRLVCAALEQAWDQGARFDLIVVDDPSDPAAGQGLVKRFQQRRRQSAGCSSCNENNDNETFVTYCPSLDGIDSHMARATAVFLGVEAVFANGALLAPAGTCDVAMTAAARGCAVIALSETVNFDGDRVATDALAYNEIDPDRCDGDAFRLLFDTTQSSLISMMICEYEEASGKVPAHATYQVTRSREDLI